MVHPRHGTGKIVKIQKNKEFVEGFEHYYVIEFLGKNLTARIPRRTLEEIGVRQAMSEAKVEDIFEILESPSQDLPGDYKERRKLLDSWLHSGSPGDIARAVQGLTRRKEQAGLNPTDKRLLREGRKRLIKEITVVTGRSSIEVRQEINQALSQAMEAEEERVLM